MKFDLVIANGILVTASDLVSADVGITGGKIAAVGHGLIGAQVIDATGKYVLPGAVDPHVHLQMLQGEFMSSDDFESGTIAAACGGTTTIIDFVEPEDDQSLLDALTARRAQADERVVIDYSLHMTLSNAQAATLAQVPAVVQAGCSSFKTYTIYDGFYLEDEAMRRAQQAVRAAGGIVLVHAEDRHIVDQKQKQFLENGQIAPRFHPRSRPPRAEGDAIERMIALADSTGCPLYVVHVSTGLGAQAIRNARQRGQVVFGETCPQYLLLNDAEYDRPGMEGARYICSPPLRSADNLTALWRNLTDGWLQTVGTDHCPFFFEGQKNLPDRDFTQIPGGMPGIESRLALLFTFGVMRKRFTLQQWVQMCCTVPAKIFGLYPQKGVLAAGADADIVIFDPEMEKTLSVDVLHERVDYSPYEGFELKGYPTVTIRRGQVLYQDGEFVGGKGGGRFLVRKHSGENLLSG